ncbi:MAG TPA: hypothetical protein PLB89_18080 [Flavobacteriales bacterium]|nr:hypothetical protein [Flavobacteriales bacterium]
MIDHAFLDRYEAAAGELERLPVEERAGLASRWTIVDELLQDLHMIKHGYTTEGYERHVERQLKALCADESVVARLKGSGL